MNFFSIKLIFVVLLQYYFHLVDAAATITFSSIRAIASAKGVATFYTFDFYFDTTISDESAAGIMIRFPAEYSTVLFANPDNFLCYSRTLSKGIFQQRICHYSTSLLPEVYI